MGTGFPYLALSALSRVNQKPYLLGSLAMMWGWIESWLQKKPRFENPEFRAYLRRYQRRAMLVGKARAIRELSECAG
jgi:hypothetical protein